MIEFVGRRRAGGVETERNIVQNVKIWWWVFHAPQEKEHVIHFQEVHEREQVQEESGQFLYVALKSPRINSVALLWTLSRDFL